MLKKWADGSVLLVAGLHVIFMIVEMTCWDTDFGRKLNHLGREAARESANLGMNPAFYNGFLGFGLFWATFALGGRAARSVQGLFLGFIVVMGLVGTILINPPGTHFNPGIFVLQALPAIIALGLTWRDRS